MRLASADWLIQVRTEGEHRQQVALNKPLLPMKFLSSSANGAVMAPEYSSPLLDAEWERRWFPAEISFYYTKVQRKEYAVPVTDALSS